MFDYRRVGCDAYRELLSARLDGEATPSETAVAETHVAICQRCRQWYEKAVTVTRMARFQTAAAGPDVVDAVLPAAPGAGRARLASGLRMVLGVLGTAQLALGAYQAVTLIAADQGAGHADAVISGATAGHLWHESAAWNLAVGAAFIWVAARRTRPGGILPILTVFVAGLAVLSVADIVAGRVGVTRLATHSFMVAGYLIVLALSRPQLSVDRPPGGRMVDDGGVARMSSISERAEGRLQDAA